MKYKDKEGNIYYAGVIENKKTIMVKYVGQTVGKIWNNKQNYK